ncbi:hypothetical protein FO519_005026 [Halicephalobus sp. NKZ332]|nr:hypothetical protein FO519_005026 [Halicephalobus sp. NKZ332]
MASEFPLACKICGDGANGKHFGAVACRACAAFFRRVTVFNLEFTCKKSNNCTLGKDVKADCKGCRLAKCREVGMDPRYVQRNRDQLGPKVFQNRKDSRNLPSLSPPEPSCSSESTSGNSQGSFSDTGLHYGFYEKIGLSNPESSIPLLTEYSKGYKNYKSLQKAAQMAYGDGSKLIEAVYPEHTFLRPDNWAFLSQIVRSHFLPSKKISNDTLDEMIKNYFPVFCAVDISALSMKNFPDKDDNRIMLTLTHYTGVDQFYSFFKIPENHPVPPMLVEGFKNVIIRTKKLFFIPFHELNLCEEELAGYLGVLFWNDQRLTNASEAELQLIQETKEALFDELYHFIYSRSVTIEEAGVRFTKLSSLIPMGFSLLEELKIQEGFCNLYGCASNEFEKEMLPHAF